MADVACFCGCCYSFEGAAGACPQCGEYAVITTTAHEDRSAADSSATGREGADGEGLRLRGPDESAEKSTIAGLSVRL
jgi:hypothetical protein